MKNVLRKEDCLTWVEIDRAAVRFNYRTLRRLARRALFDGRTPIDILPVIKAEAYGHGMLEMARLLNGLGVKFFAVSDVVEGIKLRQAGMKQRILLLEAMLPACAEDVVKYNLTPSVCTMELARAFNRAAQKRKKRLNVHIKIDTGMGRMGVWYPEAKDFIKAVSQLKQLTIEGVFTHFPVADTNQAFTCRQIGRLQSLLQELRCDGFVIPHAHAANSIGLTSYRMDFLNLARPGLMLYGLCPTEKLRRVVPLKPVMSVKSQIIFLKDIEKGRGVSYGHTFVAPRRMRVATLPIGYSNGYLRALSNKAAVIIDGQRCPVLGRVTMDQIMVDVSAVKSPRLGQEVVILGQQKKAHITAEDLADWAGTINYEIVCSLGSRLPRIFR